MVEPIKTEVFMDDKAAKQYVTMLKYWHVIKELEAIDFYRLKNGSVELHKDYLGNLSAIKTHTLITFTRHQTQ